MWYLQGFNLVKRRQVEFGMFAVVWPHQTCQTCPRTSRKCVKFLEVLSWKFLEVLGSSCVKICPRTSRKCVKFLDKFEFIGVTCMFLQNYLSWSKTNISYIEDISSTSKRSLGIIFEISAAGTTFVRHYFSTLCLYGIYCSILKWSHLITRIE